MRHSLTLLAGLSLSVSTVAMAGSMTISSMDISPGALMPKAQEFNGFGCSGDDMSPQLMWKNAPEGTKSFALTVYDPDAPTGSGWWHWQIVNIPKEVMALKTDAGNPSGNNAPTGSMQIKNDYGIAGFGGACPPPGHGAHHYQFTIHALGVEKLELPEDASGALTGYMINANTLESATLEALYKRD